jgi:hypothetical protein
MTKLKIKITNNPYHNYGTLTVDYLDELVILRKQFIESEYDRLYNRCILDIIKYIYQAKIKPVSTDNLIEVIFDANKVRKITQTDLNLISRLSNKLFDDVKYGDLEKYYSKDLYPLSPIEKLTNAKISTIVFKGYPKTHFEFFKYEDFNTFNWKVYYNYLKVKYFDVTGVNIISYYMIDHILSKYNYLILDIKQTFNRLRPFQSSLIENIPIKHYITYAGQTPALPSGHSTQGFIIGALFYSYGKKYFNSLDQFKLKSELELLIRVIRDTGHRRIMSGIHYPSDMIASWYIYLNIIKHLKLKKVVMPYTEQLFKMLKQF